MLDADFKLINLISQWVGSYQDPSVMDDEELDRRKIFVATTSVVILFTVFVQGGLTFQVLTWLKIDMGVDEDKLKV